MDIFSCFVYYQTSRITSDLLEMTVINKSCWGKNFLEL